MDRRSGGELDKGPRGYLRKWWCEVKAKRNQEKDRPSSRLNEINKNIDHGVVSDQETEEILIVKTKLYDLKKK